MIYVLTGWNMEWPSTHMMEQHGVAKYSQDGTTWSGRVLTGCNNMEWPSTHMMEH